MRPMILAALASACSGASLDAPDTLALDQAPPPLSVQVPDLYAGDMATFVVSGALPFDRVFLAGATATATPGFCPPVLQGACLTLDAPVLIGTAIANGAGRASLRGRVPAGAAGSLVWLQAAAVGRGGVLVSSRSLHEIYDPACPQIVADFWAEAADVRTCTFDSDCGQVLTGTSCGCTRDWVAAVGVDTTDFYTLLSQAGSCGVGLISTCDCPATNGFLCDAGTCTWNYVP